MLGVEAVSDARLPVEARDLASDARWPLREGGSRELPPFPSNVLLFNACRLATRQTDHIVNNEGSDTHTYALRNFGKAQMVEYKGLDRD